MKSHQKKETVGLITYMRTDSIRLSNAFINETKDYIEQKYGKNYVGLKASISFSFSTINLKATD